MKNIKISFLAMIFTAAVTVCGMYSAPFSASCAVASEIQASDTSSVTKDLNRDGKTEQITFQAIRRDPADSVTPYADFAVSVNGKATSIVINEAWFYTYDYEFFDMDKKTFLFISLNGDDDDGAKRVYSWTNGDFKLQIDLNREFKEYHGACMHLSAKVGKVKGLRLTMNVCSQFTGLPGSDIEKEYLLRRGNLEPMHQTSTVVTCYNTGDSDNNGTKYLYANHKIVTYTTRKCQKKSVKWIKSGDKVRVSKLYIGKGYTSYYVKGKGWYRVKNNSFCADKLFSGVVYVG